MNAQIQRPLHRLIAAIRDDLASHERILALLERQEDSVRRPTSEAFQAATEGLERELAGAAARTARREDALAGLAAAFCVPPSAMTIRSAVQRLGDGGTALAADHERLRGLARRVDQRGRRVATLVRLHRQVTRELIQVVLGPSDGADVQAGGSLIDAEV